MVDWNCVLELDSNRNRKAGSEKTLCDSIRRAADLHIETEFRHNEHIDVNSDNNELIREVAEFRITYLIDDRWTAGIMSLRQPVSLPDGFGERPSMSFFLYNQDGSQAIARPYLDGKTAKVNTGQSINNDHNKMTKYHELDSWDAGTNAPSSNFVYSFDVFRYMVCDNWQEILSHNTDGRVISGSIDSLADAFTLGCEVKVAIRGLCADLAEIDGKVINHEVFIHLGSCYYYTEEKLFIAGSHPVVRVRPAVPLRYLSRGWDFGWLIVKTDGSVVMRICNPYTLKFSDTRWRCSLRWFVR